MAIKRYTKILASTSAAVLLLSACVETQDASMDTTTPAEQAPSSPTTSAGPATSDMSVGGNLPDEASINAPPEQCTTNPIASDFAPFLEQGKIPTGLLGDGPGSVVPTGDGFYHFQIGENGYDSCAELSYLVLNGSNGDEERSAGIGSAIADALVLFHRGAMITSPAPFQMKTVEKVIRISDAELEVLYGHAGRSTPEGVTEHHTFTFMYAGDGLTGEGSLPGDIDQHLRLYLL